MKRGDVLGLLGVCLISLCFYTFCLICCVFHYYFNHPVAHILLLARASGDKTGVIAQVTGWSDSHEFRFSPHENSHLALSRVRGSFQDPELYLCGRRLPMVEQTRFVCVMFDPLLI